MRTTSFLLTDQMYRRVNLAAAALDGMSCGEYIRRAINAALDASMENNPLIATAFRIADESEAEEREIVERWASK